jgi:hypothetical protein
MVLCALAVGVIAGFGAVVFRAMIGGFHNLLFQSPDGRAAPATGCHILVDPEALLPAVLRALDEAGAQFALVVPNAAGGSQEVMGVITERDVARLAYGTARMTD